MSYEYLVRFPPFKEGLDSKLSCKQFLFVMDQFAEINAWPESELIRIIAECMSLEMDNLLSSFPSYELLKIHLLSISRPKLTFKEKDILKQSLMQWNGETVTEFYHRCEEVHHELIDQYLLDELHEADILSSFVAGLQFEIRDQFLKKIPCSKKEFLHEAVKIESTLSGNDNSSFFEGLDDNCDIGKFEEDDKAFFCDFKFKCESCDMSFQSQSVLEEHQNREHKVHECLRCNEKFPTFQQLMKHHRSIHKDETNKIYTCPLCGVQYKSKCSLRAHKQRKHGGKTFQCEQCPSTFPTEQQLKGHHASVHLKIRDHICEDCGKAFFLKHRLIDHLASKHGKGQVFQCDQCDFKCGGKKALDWHISNRHKSGPHICDLCGAVLRTKQYLRDHKITKHTEDGGKKFPCPHPDCNSNFRLPCKLKTHVMRVHEKAEKPYACTLCPEKYWGPGRLKEHMNGVHLNKRPYKCSQCDYASAYPSTLKAHVRASHEGEQYPCPFPGCNHYARYKGNLDKHIQNIHTKKMIL